MSSYFLDDRKIPNVKIKFRTRVGGNREDAEKWQKFISQLSKQEKSHNSYCQISMLRNHAEVMTYERVYPLIKNEVMKEEFRKLGKSFDKLNGDLKAYAVAFLEITFSDLV